MLGGGIEIEEFKNKQPFIHLFAPSASLSRLHIIPLWTFYKKHRNEWDGIKRKKCSLENLPFKLKEKLWRDERKKGAEL